METLRAANSLEFEMVYHVNSKTFEKVIMRNADSKDILGNATYSTAAAPAAQQNRGGSPPAPQARAAAAAQSRPAAAQQRQPAPASAKNRNKSVVATTAKRVGNNGRGPAAAGARVNNAAFIPKNRPGMPGMPEGAFENAAANLQALGEEHKTAEI